jgi:dynein heavy chain, axonemal
LFFPWPEDALLNVANKFLADYKVECSDEIKKELINHMSTVHLSMNKISEQYFERFRRHVYTTPKSYLSFINQYKQVYETRFKEINSRAVKIVGGLEKIEKASLGVEKLKIELKEKELKLSISQKETDELLKEISVKTASSEKKKNEVEKEKNKIGDDFEIVNKNKIKAEKELESAKPALIEADNALKNIKPNDINELRSMKAPSELVQRVFDCCIILSQQSLDKIKIIEKDKKGLFYSPSWDQSKKMMNDTKNPFLKSLQEFAKTKKDQINEETCELMMPYIFRNKTDDEKSIFKDKKDEEKCWQFNDEDVKSASLPAQSLYKWASAMCLYHNVSKTVKPLMEELFIQEGQLKIANQKLKSKQDELSIVVNELNSIQKKFDDATKKKKELQDDAEKTKRFMEQANSLINGLSGETKRWKKQSNE